VINKLPKWVEIGGFFLALIAGSVNAIALLGFNHQGVSHLTGSSTLLGVELAQGNHAEAIHLVLIRHWQRITETRKTLQCRTAF